ncbi:MAG: BTAD domain-containing putative transcriptional regulator [Pseudomonadota bacterium]
MDKARSAEEPAGRFHLSLIHGWQLTMDGTPIPISGVKNRALLSYLILESRGHYSRDVLAELFWPEGDARKSKASLRQAHFLLKKALADTPCELDATSDQITVVAPAMESDFSIIPVLLEEMASRDAAPRLTFEQAMRDFEGLSPDLDDWLAAVRDQATQTAAAYLKSTYSDTSQDFETRFKKAQMALAFDEYDEDAVRTMMLCQMGMNAPGAALRLYGEFFEKLERELDAEPSMETQDLAVQIKLSNEAPPQVPTAVTTTMPAQVQASPFVSTTIAVLPFECLGPVEIPDYVLIGVLDQITSHLSSFKAPAVISSNSTRRYLGAIPDPMQIGAELGVNYVVSGMVRTGQDRSLVSVQLVETSGARVVWAFSQEIDTAYLFGFDQRLAEHIAGAIVPSVNVSELDATKESKTSELEPYHLILRAKELIFRFNKPSIHEAGGLIERAVEINPFFSPAHTLMAEWYSIAMWQGWSTDPKSDRTRMDDHLRRAISLSPDDGRALALWGHSRHMFDREIAGPLDLFERAVALCPNDSETLIWTVPGTAMNGRAKAAIERGRKAMDLSPLDPFRFRNEHFLSLACYLDGDFDQAADLGLASFRQAPDYGSNLRATIAALVSAGRIDETPELVVQHGGVEPEFSVEKFIPYHGIRDPLERRKFGDRLIEAGLPK